MSDAIITFFASYSQYVLAALLAVWALWPRRHIRESIVALGAAGIARLAVKPLILLFVHRARPNGMEFDSFPSGHALFFFAIAAVVYRYNKKLGIVFFIGATLMGIGRVLDGLHWTTDILAGAALGILVGWAVQKIYARFCHQS
jgi:membrane-associated phospholipid phosphatase